MSATRRVRVRAFAKINLDLRVLGRRPDGYHELRTVFQTISLADTLDIAFTATRTTSVQVEDGLGIPDNLAGRAAQLTLDAMRVHGRVELRLRKRIPMGAGLGGGSSDAAAVLLALPALAERRLSLPDRSRLARKLGSDVGFFLLGGTAAGIGRGDEVFPIEGGPVRSGWLIAPGIHVNTAQAYRDLSPRLQGQDFHPMGLPPVNDFEAVVLAQHPRLAALKRALARAGASPAMMTGSGSAVFGLFDTPVPVDCPVKLREPERAFRFTTVSRARYQRIWQQALAPFR